jgi:hypothetical protein
MILKTLLLALGSVFYAAAQADSATPDIDPHLARIVDHCQPAARPLKQAKQVLFFKQWHLAPKTLTTDIESSKKLPQYLNQKELYEQVDAWIVQKKVSALIAEGCPYPRAVSLDSPENFNGWTVSSLSARSGQSDYADVLTNVAFKLEAKWKSVLIASCGDDEDASKNGSLAFSDGRGVVGFLSRLEQYRNDPDHARTYLDGVIEIYHLSPSTTVEQAIHHLNLELKKVVDSIEKWTEARNEKLVRAILANPNPVIVTVFGGAHASGVKTLLEKNGIGCTILEPVDYRDDESELLAQLKTLVSQRLRTMK